MSALIIDSYNVLQKTTAKARRNRYIFSFFNYVEKLREKYSRKKVFFVFDGIRYYKKKIYEGYKRNRKATKCTHFNKALFTIILNIPNYYLAYDHELEADDLSYCLCKELDNSVCVSEDRDWLLNLTANNNIKVYRKNCLWHKLNFKQKKLFEINKIPLFLFLAGDSKDGVKKPFRLKGSVLENVNKYDSIDDYIEKNRIDSQEVETYKKLIFPITDKRFEVLEGKKNECTREVINKYKLNFLKLYRRKRKVYDY